VRVRVRKRARGASKASAKKARPSAAEAGEQGGASEGGERIDRKEGVIFHDGVKRMKCVLAALPTHPSLVLAGASERSVCSLRSNSLIVYAR
jgi:hypothetical protein